MTPNGHPGLSSHLESHRRAHVQRCLVARRHHDGTKYSRAASGAGRSIQAPTITVLGANAVASNNSSKQQYIRRSVRPRPRQRLRLASERAGRAARPRVSTSPGPRLFAGALAPDRPSETQQQQQRQQHGRGRARSTDSARARTHTFRGPPPLAVVLYPGM
ncbi:uncharacterized protein K452DRAFT_103229 [Aplosporella prunicola CBS 121167]|uniref:Uncharacterized protein n=1 Tax=Aplosporella prunicola CBS 121167 TaxID=1176127 RepID=A0A6A6BPB5_9PEZI|nr:uncharacterized protein K452DRAFT_103229 [Aplosporella prunicola CBS 121167]KAF2145916.1 hypothetical protein K452DRAFT_103229 [Aplosporella prunicola CBS 121167]